MDIHEIARDWHLISVREPQIPVCSHGRPDHQMMLNQLAAAMGFVLPALPCTPAQAWSGLLDIIEKQFNADRRVEGGWDSLK